MQVHRALGGLWERLSACPAVLPPSPPSCALRGQTDVGETESRALPPRSGSFCFPQEWGMWLEDLQVLMAEWKPQGVPGEHSCPVRVRVGSL